MINQAQMDRWNIVTTLNYLPTDDEVKIIQARVPNFNNEAGLTLVKSMIAVADMTRNSFAAGDISTLMSPRTVISWAENIEIFRDPAIAFRLSFLNKCDEAERPMIAEFFQRCFDQELTESWAHKASGVMTSEQH
jgi:cobaltochelatase CobS